MSSDAPLLRIRGLVRVHRSGDVDVRALDGVDLDIAEGEFVAIMGASGSGKSTLLTLLGGLDRPTAGTYHLAGEDVTTLSKPRLAALRNRRIGFVFQSFHLLARTSAVENVELPMIYAGVPPRDRRQRALAALERVGLKDRAGHTPAQLSGGQQQRVAIARALVNTPSLILADEPTGNLDSKTSVEVMALLQDLHRAGNTIVMVTHEHDIAAHASRVVVMKDGRVVRDERQAPVEAGR